MLIELQNEMCDDYWPLIRIERARLPFVISVKYKREKMITENYPTPISHWINYS
jgi:hypothetical protein